MYGCLLKENVSQSRITRYKKCLFSQTGSSSKVVLSACFFSWVVKGSPSGLQQVFQSLALLLSPVVSDVVFSPRSQKCNVEPQLSEPQSPLSLSHRSLPTSSSCYCGQSSSLVLPQTAPLLVLVEGKWIGRWSGMGLVRRQAERRKTEAEKRRGSAYVKTAQRRLERQRKQPAHVREPDGVSE